MKFNKSNAAYYGSRGGCAATHKKSEKTLAREAELRKQKLCDETRAFEEFATSEAGTFNGFAFAEVFHERIKKSDAVLVDYADDCATCHGVPVGVDGIKCYFYCEPSQVRKRVEFNRSVYLFG